MSLRQFAPFSALLLLAATSFAQQPAQLDSLTRGQLHAMLRNAHEDVSKYYYDPHFHGVDMDALYKKMDPKLDTVQTLNQGFAVIAGYLDALGDSHTFFNPPPRTDRSRMDFKYQMIGDRCFITHVKAGTDAAKKLHPGDEIVTFDGFKPERATFTAMSYYFGVLATTPATALVLRDPQGTQRREVVQNEMMDKGHFRDYMADSGGLIRKDLVAEGERWHDINKSRFLEAGDVLVWKLPEFVVSGQDIDEFFWMKVNKHPVLIIDLRNDPGGAVETLQEITGHFFENPETIATLETRKPEKPEIAKPKGHQYHGKVIVLVDTKSASCSELFARVVQLEHRGTVIGDHTLGLVMMSKHYDDGSMTGDFDMAAHYGFSITHANLIMTDGQSLEKHGVTPDELVVPTASDLAAGRDPVLERAVTEAGGKYDADAVAKAFPYLWPPEEQD